MWKSVASKLACVMLSLGSTSCYQASHTQPDFAAAETNNALAENNASGSTVPNCKVDIPQASEIDDSDKKFIMSLCREHYPKITALIGENPTSPAINISIIIKPIIDETRKRGTAEAQGDKIFLDDRWFVENRPNQQEISGDSKQNWQEISGVLAHEMVHIVQMYQKEVPSWVTEGIADYVRFSMGYKEESDLSCNEGQHYSADAYTCAPALFKYIAKKYPEAIAKLNLSFRANGYDETLFAQEDITGQTLEQLWQECLSEDCAGGRSQF